jgi:hypothetical protein
MTTELTYDLMQMRTILSGITAFRTWAGETTSAGALTHISLWSDDSPVMPLCVISHGPAWRREMTTFSTYSTMPELSLVFVNAVTRTTTNESAFTTLMTAIDGIMAGLEAQTTTGYAITDWQMSGADTPSRARHQNGQDYVALEVVISGGQR